MILYDTIWHKKQTRIESYLDQKTSLVNHYNPWLGQARHPDPDGRPLKANHPWKKTKGMENQSSKKRIEWLSNVTTPYYTTALKVLRLGMNLRIIEGIWRGNLQGPCTAVPKPISQAPGVPGASREVPSQAFLAPARKNRYLEYAGRYQVNNSHLEKPTMTDACVSTTHRNGDLGDGLLLGLPHCTLILESTWESPQDSQTLTHPQICQPRYKGFHDGFISRMHLSCSWMLQGSRHTNKGS